MGADSAEPGAWGKGAESPCRSCALLTSRGIARASRRLPRLAAPDCGPLGRHGHEARRSPGVALGGCGPQGRPDSAAAKQERGRACGLSESAGVRQAVWEGDEGTSPNYLKKGET